jgi:hypothetical protein
MTKVSENANSKIYTAHTNIPIPTMIDMGITYIIHLHQEGIIDSIDIKILLDYDKDYPLRLFDRCELFYGGELIARNNYLYSMLNVEKDVYTINDIFPGYEFRLDTTNKPLEFKLQRNTIAAKPNDIKITYKINTIELNEKPMLKYDTTLSPCQKCKRCKHYQTSVYLEHEPYYFDRYYIYGNRYDNDNYSNKPVKRLHGNFTTYILNDELRSANLNELHKGSNRFTLKPEFEDIDEPVDCIIHYSYLV